MVKLSRLEEKKGWWFEPRSSVPCALPADGLVCVFNLEDVKAVLDEHYPTKKYRDGKIVWYFNETRDREIAECDDGKRVTANPQVLWTHFMKEPS